MTSPVERVARIQRSELAVPATSIPFFEKAARGPADTLFLDLEDAVAPPRRAEARANAVTALNEVDWGTKTVSVRVNGLTTPWAIADIIAVARCPRLDMILLPKVETAGDVEFLDRLLTGLELEIPRERPLGIEILIETTKGLANVEAIAAASPRLEGIIFGVGDYSIELENFDTIFGASNPDYAVLARGEGAPQRHWNDQWHFALARIANACRAYGLRPIDGPFTNYGDPEGYRESAIRARALGLRGEMGNPSISGGHRQRGFLADAGPDRMGAADFRPDGRGSGQGQRRDRCGRCAVRSRACEARRQDIGARRARREARLMPAAGPLGDIRVLDIATFVAAPFCGTILSDFGAEVIKIEQPGIGDSLRRFGTATDCGDTLVWLSEARNRESVTLDLRKPEGVDLFKRLVAVSDVVLENFRPGTLEKWGLGYDVLAAINPKLVMLRVSAYGQTGPMRGKPGFARIAHAFSGLAYLSGEPGRPPVVPGSTSLADYMTGMFGAIGVLIALRHAEQTGEGQEIDIGLYESIFRVLDELAPAYAKFGYQRERMGPDTVNIVPHSHYETRDGHWVALACSNDRMWERLTMAMGRPELADDTRYAKIVARADRRAEVNGIVAQWVGSLPVADVLAACEAAEAPCSKLLSIADIFNDPQYAARGNLMAVRDPRVGDLVLPAALPRMSRTPPVFRGAGPALGSGNAAILGTLLGLDDAAIDALAARGIV